MMPAALLASVLAFSFCAPFATALASDLEAALKVGLVVTPAGTKSDLSKRLRQSIEQAARPFAAEAPGVKTPALEREAEARSAISPISQQEAPALDANRRMRVELLIDEDDCTPAGGAAAARRLATAGVALVLGHPCSNAAMAAAKVYAEAGIVFLAVGARHPDLTQRRAGPLVFRLGGRDDRQGADTAAALASKLAGRRIAIVHDRTRYMRRLSEDVAAGLRARGIPDIVVFPIVAGERGYDGLLASLRQKAPDALYLALFPAEALLIAKTAVRGALNAQLIFADSVSSEAIAEHGLAAAAPIAIRATEKHQGEALPARAAAAFVRLVASSNAWIAARASAGQPLEAGGGTNTAGRVRAGAIIRDVLSADQIGDLEGPSFEADEGR